MRLLKFFKNIFRGGKDRGGFESEAESVVSRRSSRRSARRTESDGKIISSVEWSR